MVTRDASQPPGSGLTGRRAFVPLHSPFRWLAALALVGAGAVHVPIIGEHLEEAPYIGVLFIALTAACGVLAVLIVLWDAIAVWAVAGVVAALAVVGYVLSRTVGLPQIGDDKGNWGDPLGVAALITEGLMVLLALWVLRRQLARAQAAGEPGTA